MDEATRTVCARILPAGVSLVDGPPPAAPTSFEDDYVLPCHYDKPLQTLHTHPLDQRLCFYEVPHIYTVDDVPTSASVTELAHQFEKPFVADEAIRLMRASRSQAWPRREYVVGERPLDEWHPSKGALMLHGGRTIAVVPPRGTERDCVESVKRLLHSCRVRGADPVDDVEYACFERALTDDEIKATWTRKGVVASHRGTEAHYQAELMLNGLPFRFDDPESRVLLDFARDHLLPRGLVSYATEKEIVCLDADVAGSIDAIVYDPARDVHHIIDYKRTDKLQRDLRGYARMGPPFDHLDDCKGCAYALQLSLYQYVLERDYGLTIGDRVLLSLHPDRPFVTSVPYMRAEVDHIMRRRFACVVARRSVAVDPAFRCSLSGAPVVDAVRLENGAVAMRKAALVAGRSFEDAPDVRAAFEREVRERVVDVPFHDETRRTWRQRMPESGLPPFVGF